MDIRVSLGDWLAHRAAAQALRYEVFVLEQSVPVELEWDEMDAASLHGVAFDADGTAIATGRLLPDGHIGRMAVKREMRGRGIGAVVLQALLAEAKKRGHAEVMLSAQTHAEPFYGRLGFRREGEEFMDAGIPHIHMRLRFD